MIPENMWWKSPAQASNETMAQEVKAAVDHLNKVIDNATSAGLMVTIEREVLILEIGKPAAPRVRVSVAKPL